MLRARWTGRRVVRTLHNAEPHERHGIVVRATLRLVDRTTTGWIRLNDHTPVPTHGFVVTIPHGTYADWYADTPRPARRPGRLAYVGLVRPYKGVDDLIAAFAQLDLPDVSLHVSGRPVDAEYGRAIARLAGADPRVVVDLRHVPDGAMAREIGEATLVVLPYREMHNSGAALLALSLGRPVLVPANAVTDDLAHEVGEQWVQRFAGTFDARALNRALGAVEGLDGSPDLSARSWEAIADQHVVAFARAVDIWSEHSIAAP
nr:glycosyltransferase [Cellulomonas sp. JH27-2]